MSTYSLRPVTAHQIRRRRQGLLLGLACSLLLLVGTVPIRMKLQSSSEVCNWLFYVSASAAIAAFACWFGLWNYPESVAGRDRSSWEVTQDGVRKYAAPASAFEQGRSLPRRLIRYFEMAPNGSLVVRGPLGGGTIGGGTIVVPNSLDGIDQFRQELLDAGIPELHRSSIGWFFLRLRLWSAYACLGLVAYYMTWGSYPQLVLASTIIFAIVLVWSWSIMRRVVNHKSRMSELLLLALAVFWILQGSSHAWHIAHPAHHGESTIISLRGQPPQGA